MEDRKIAMFDAQGVPNRAALAVASVSVAVAGAFGDEQSATASTKRFTPCPSHHDGIPNRLSIDRASRYYSPCGAYIGVEIDGQDVTGLVVEYDVREGWVRIADAPRGTKLSYYQVTSAPKRHGIVETFWARQPNRQIRRQLARVPA